MIAPGAEPIQERHLARYAAQATYCPASSHGFALDTVEAIVGVLPGYRRCRMHISAATPPYAADDASLVPDGHVEIVLFGHPLEEKSIGIIFGARGEADRVMRTPFDADAWRTDPRNPWASGIAAFNFDEAWRIVVLLATEIEASGIEISYGLGM